MSNELSQEQVLLIWGRCRPHLHPADMSGPADQVHAARMSRIRAQIEDDTYESPGKLDVAVARLLDDLNGRTDGMRYVVKPHTRRDWTERWPYDYGYMLWDVQEGKQVGWRPNEFAAQQRIAEMNRADKLGAKQNLAGVITDQLPAARAEADEPGDRFDGLG